MSSKFSLRSACALFAGMSLLGCGLLESRTPSPAVLAQAPSARPTKPASKTAAPAPVPARRIGDFFVHRFSGTFAAEPLLLTEEVVAREPSAWVVDFSLTQGEDVQRIRIRFDAATGEPIAASRLSGKDETPATLRDYEALLARTIYAADVNDGLLERASATCLVGPEELDCETKSYKVWVGDTEAKLSVVHAERFADRDVSGEITTSDGKVIYRAELLEATHAQPVRGVALGR